MNADSDKWRKAERLLCVRLDTLGDVLLTTPAIRALKYREPHARRHITLLTSTIGAEIAALVPEIDDIIAYDAPWMKATAPRHDAEPDRAFVEQLRRRHFDAAVIFTTFSQSPLPAALMCYLADIPLRLALAHENPYQLLTAWVKDPEPQHGIRHEVERQIELVSTIGSGPNDEHLSLRIPPAAQDRLLQRFAQLPIDIGRPWAIIHPGASASSRRYPLESFARVAQTLVREHGWQIVFTGDQAEFELVQSIRLLMNAPSYSFAGQLNVAELAALISMAPIMIVNNTGPAHIAAAVGTPVVVLYALTNPQHTPWQVPSRVLSHDVPCKYCFKSVCPEGHHHCLRLIEPQAVVEAALDLIKVSFTWKATAVSQSMAELTLRPER